MVKVGINGFGRIGRCVLRACAKKGVEVSNQRRDINVQIYYRPVCIDTEMQCNSCLAGGGHQRSIYQPRIHGLHAKIRLYAWEISWGNLCYGLLSGGCGWIFSFYFEVSDGVYTLSCRSKDRSHARKRSKENSVEEVLRWLCHRSHRRFYDKREGRRKFY